MKLLRREKLMAAVGAGLCLFAWLWFRLSRSLGEGAGPMRAFGLLLGRGLCRIFSILPLAMAELVWIGGLLYALFILIDLLRKRGLWGIPAWLCRAILAAGIIYTLFSVVYLCAMMTVYSPPLRIRNWAKRSSKAIMTAVCPGSAADTHQGSFPSGGTCCPGL